MTKTELRNLDVFLFSQEEAARLLRISRAKLQEFIRAGEIEVVVLDERKNRVQIAYEDLRKFIERKKKVFVH